ncbi:MAG: ribosome maturation factor RimM [Nitrospinaceae bacterium]|nr:MAG: ribosome maturation factor RimM [Nitrospinaceae bacterium]
MKWVPVGKLSRTHGLKGELKFQSFFPDSESLKSLHRLLLKGTGGQKSELEFESLRGHSSSLIIKLKGIDSVDDAKALTGRNVFALEDEFPRLPEGEYYRFQIKGLKAYDREGRYYGQVEDIIETGSNDVYVVRDGKKEILIPMIDWVVKSIDMNENKLVFDNVEGLIEDSPV